MSLGQAHGSYLDEGQTSRSTDPSKRLFVPRSPPVWGGLGSKAALLRVIGVSRSPLLLARKQQNQDQDQDQCLGGRPPAITSVVPRGPAGSSALRRGRPGTGADARVGIPQSGSLQGGYFSLCHVDLAVCRADVESESRRLAERRGATYNSLCDVQRAAATSIPSE